MPKPYEKRRARFVPKNRVTLRPSMAQHIGKTFDFTFGWVMDDDDPYPGQGVWLFDRKHDAELGDDCGRWVPDEDLQ